MTDVVKGISLNSNLYTTEEDIDENSKSQNSDWGHEKDLFNEGGHEKDLFNEIEPDRLRR